jgi:hypothetical protein
MKSATTRLQKCHFSCVAPLFFCQTGPFWGRFWLSNYYILRKWFSLSVLQDLKKQRFFKKTPQEFKIIRELDDFVRGMFVKGMGDNLPSVIPLTIIALTVALAAFCRKIGRGMFGRGMGKRQSPALSLC